MGELARDNQPVSGTVVYRSPEFQRNPAREFAYLFRAAYFDQDAVLELRGHESNSLVLAVYVRAGESIDVPLILGWMYRLQLVTGELASVSDDYAWVKATTEDLGWVAATDK